MSNNSKVDDFLAKLAAQTPKKSEEAGKVSTRALDKVYLSYPGNHGRYQVLPMDSVITDYPFITLFDTREICIPRKNIAADGSENVYSAWIKLLPKVAYQMKDMAGRVTSSLTAAEEQLLDQAYKLFDNLYYEGLDAKNNRELASKLGRKRNYTIFHAYCVNKWGLNDVRAPQRQNFSALFVCTAKGFIDEVENNIQERILMNGNNAEWIPLIYNRQLSGRGGYLMFSIAPNKSNPGFTTSASHEFGNITSIANSVIPEEDAELMQDPVQSFLGWQANRDEENPMGQKRLFNSNLIKEAIEFMTKQISAIRMASQRGVSISDAIEATNQEILAAQTPTNRMGQTTNDPLLAKMSGGVDSGSVGVIDPTAIVENNTDPFQTPPVSRVDPITSAPTGLGEGYKNGGNDSGRAPFSQPSFAGGFGGGNNGNLPF